MFPLRRLCGLTLCALISAASEEHSERSFAVESAASLSNVGAHGRAEKSHQRESNGATNTASMIRRESAASELEEDHATVSKKARTNRTKSVSWTQCEGGSCQCSSRRRMVIRYQRERKAGNFVDQENVMTNWYYRSQSTAYEMTSMTEFNKGFKTVGTAAQCAAGSDACKKAYELSACGGDTAYSKDCLVAPSACAFDTCASGDTPCVDAQGCPKNPYDALPGEYCCDGASAYCSYRCEESEVFHCPALSASQGFPGGMDPAGPDVQKRCYMATYLHGMNPEIADDGNTGESAACQNQTVAG